MQALVVGGQSPTLESNRPVPEPAAGEALIRTTRVAVGGLDAQLSRGLLGFRGILGHQFVGRVESVAHEDTMALTGKRVIGSITCVCESCDMCLAGLSAHCRERSILGIQNRDGCLAEYFTLPQKNLLAVADSVDDDHAVFTELLASAIQAARQLTIEGHPYITVLGDGGLGLLMVQVMSRLNASVRLIGRYPEKLALCEKWGIKHRHVDDIGRRADQDVVVDCTDSPAGLELAMQLVRPRGTIMMKSLVAPNGQPEPGVDLNPLVLNEVQIIGSHRGPLAEALSMLARREVDVVSLISRRMSLADGVDILKAAVQPDVVKVLVNV
ncbi:MAG: alcohol dehydrogenase catalytic domain-containing protein [Phycisphaerales bacterium]|nr:MAG: alcohol dehydrogenase catalytic domain-containing protein [Phycisphaerales bacterium]